MRLVRMIGSRILYTYFSMSTHYTFYGKSRQKGMKSRKTGNRKRLRKYYAYGSLVSKVAIMYNIYQVTGTG